MIKNSPKIEIPAIISGVNPKFDIITRKASFLGKPQAANDITSANAHKPTRRATEHDNNR